MTTRIIKAYNGSTFEPRAVKVWDGTSWVERQARWWDGTKWIPELPPWELTVRTGSFSFERGFTISFSAGSNLQIEWGDGTSQNVTSGTSVSKTYPASNTDYTVRLKGSIGSAGRIWFPSSANTASITETSVISTVIGITSFHSTFQGSALTSIPTGLFSRTPNITSFYQTFYNCVSLEGEAPPLWEMFPNVTGGGCFRNCTKLSNYAQIPSGWK